MESESLTDYKLKYKTKELIPKSGCITVQVVLETIESFKQRILSLRNVDRESSSKTSLFYLVRIRSDFANVNYTKTKLRGCTITTRNGTWGQQQEDKEHHSHAQKHSGSSHKTLREGQGVALFSATVESFSGLGSSPLSI